MEGFVFGTVTVIGDLLHQSCAAHNLLTSTTTRPGQVV
jgi:hypothetical protein